jgi:hypothetical protein
MLRNIYIALGSLSLALYGWMAFTGWELGSPEREPVGAELRGTHGYRSVYIFSPGAMHGK